MKQNKYLLIGVSVLLIASILLFVFRKKIFKKSSARVETDNISQEANTQPAATVSATATNSIVSSSIHTLKVGDRAFSKASQTITRVEKSNGNYVNTGSGKIGKDDYIGVVIKLTPNGYYIQARAGLSAPYYYVGTSQVK